MQGRRRASREVEEQLGEEGVAPPEPGAGEGRGIGQGTHATLRFLNEPASMGPCGWNPLYRRCHFTASGVTQPCTPASPPRTVRSTGRRFAGRYGGFAGRPAASRGGTAGMLGGQPLDLAPNRLDEPTGSALPTEAAASTQVVPPFPTYANTTCRSPGSRARTQDPEPPVGEDSAQRPTRPAAPLRLPRLFPPGRRSAHRPPRRRPHVPDPPHRLRPRQTGLQRLEHLRAAPRP